MSALGGPRSLIALMFTGPHVGIRQRWPNVLHAVTSEGLPIKSWPKGLAVSACGKRGVRLVQSGDGPVSWPPRVRSLPAGYERCAECFVATGKPRPQSEFASTPSPDTGETR